MPPSIENFSFFTLSTFCFVSFFLSGQFYFPRAAIVCPLLIAAFGKLNKVNELKLQKNIARPCTMNEREEGNISGEKSCDGVDGGKCWLSFWSEEENGLGSDRMV